MLFADFLIIGSGIAGLTYGLKIAAEFPESKVRIVTKSSAEESNTRYAQGGIAAVWDFDKDSFNRHIEDTLIAGDGLCKRAVVEMVVQEGPALLKELMQWGAIFDREPSGKLNLGLEGGHSANRIIHHKDITGFEIEKTLLEKVRNTANIELFPNHFAMDIITEHHFDKKNSDGQLRCYGAYVLLEETGQIIKCEAKITLLATGGVGEVYQNTTNPFIATGDGIAMAYRAKAKIINMEFIQFHPTALYTPNVRPAFLISEAVRGFGAQLKDKQGTAFMHKYDERKELSSRDIVARAIDNELKKSGDHCVYLDCRNINSSSFEKHFPTITQKCLDNGINFKNDMIPVVPVAHYLCGGIEVDEWGQTNIDYLFACGECACTGLHGANRLASNSLLEALVFAHRSFKKSIEIFSDISSNVAIPDWDMQGTTEPKEKILIQHNREEVQRLMSNYVSIVRSSERLIRSSKRLEILYNETQRLYERSSISVPLCELRNMIAISHLIVQHSLNRKENRGTFYNVDL